MFNFFFYTNNFLNIFFDPLEQFDVFQIDILINNLIFFYFFLTFLYTTILHNEFNTNSKNENWNFLFFSIYQIFNFTKNIINTNILLSKQFFLILYYFIFLFILGSNLIGLIPYSFTITSSFIITFATAFIILFIINVLAIYNNGFHRFIGFFLPRGTPIPIAILLVFIEIVSYVARLFSLSIRLFANMMAGHTLLKILIGFSFTIIFSFKIFSIFAIFPWIVVSCIVILEILIALLQAYVSLILICIYCNDILQLH